MPAAEWGLRDSRRTGSNAQPQAGAVSRWEEGRVGDALGIPGPSVLEPQPKFRRHFFAQDERR